MVHALCGSLSRLYCIWYMHTYGSMARLYCIRCVDDWYKLCSLRQGSGSACRSIYGGFVEWTMGTEVDGSDCRALQIASETHWPQMRVLILVVSDYWWTVEKLVLCTFWMCLNGYFVSNIFLRLGKKLSLCYFIA